MSDYETVARQIEGKTKEELIRYGRLTFGLNVNAAFKKVEIEKMILAAAQKFAGNAQIRVNSDSTLKPGYARIKLNSTELNKKGRPAILGLQGRMFSLPVGVTIDVPVALVEILNNAVQYQYETNPETGELDRREVHSYPFTQFAYEPALPKVQKLKKTAVVEELEEDEDFLEDTEEE